MINLKNDRIDCDLDHPIFNVIESDTRRQILRLIACEHNYGNRIASILGLSTPAVHRHLKLLQTQIDDEDGTLIKVSEKSSESYSGHKGAEATLYQIDKKVGIFFGIFPNFIHSQVFKVAENGEVTASRSQEYENDYFALKPPIPKTDEAGNYINGEFYNLYQVVQDYNEQIVNLQKKMMELMYKKNDVMDQVDKIFLDNEDLDFEARVIMRAITCLGPDCASSLANILNMENVVVDNHISNIIDTGLLEKRDV